MPLPRILPRVRGRVLRWALASVLGVAATMAAGAAAAPELDDAAGGSGVIVAIGDVHADADALLALLRREALVDDARKWTGGRTTLVQTGDYLDRGVQVRDVLDLLMSLEPQARAAGGRVIVLMGNHEGMNALGVLRDVSPLAFAAFADAQSEARRHDAFAAHVAVADARRTALAKTDSTLTVPPVYAAPDRDAWMAAHPPGWVEYREAFGPKGAYGHWLRARPVAVRIDDTVFVHGGFNPDVAPKKIDAATDQTQKELARWDRMCAYMIDRGLATPWFTFTEMVDAGRAELARVARDAARSTSQTVPEPPGTLPEAVVRHPLAELLGVDAWSLLNANSPLWFRGFATWTSEQGRMGLDALQNRYGPVRFVVGHTPLKPPRQLARFDRRVFLIDTGISSAYRADGGRPSALEIGRGAYTAVYLDSRDVLFDAMSSAVR